jgi:hypothetical protein
MPFVAPAEYGGGRYVSERREISGKRLASDCVELNGTWHLVIISLPFAMSTFDGTCWYCVGGNSESNA